MVFWGPFNIYTVHVCDVFEVKQIRFILNCIKTVNNKFIKIPHSRHILGGFCAAIYYFSIHNDATRLQTNPTSRDNFAFPFLFGQMYFLSAWIESHNRHYANDPVGDEQDSDRSEDKVRIVQVIEYILTSSYVN